MKTCGIVAEYNPFHNGHAYQIQQARMKSNADTIIVVMSGNFVQRGEPAIIDKWKRSEAAVLNGADVVVELPYFYATQAANQFAKGAIEILKLAHVDAISFGSECGNLENLLDISDTPINVDHLHVSLESGMSYPKAYSLLTNQMFPNDILAVSYLNHMKGTDIEPIVIQRTNEYNDDSIAPTCSALAIRKALHEHHNLENSTPMIETLEKSELVFSDMFYPYLRTLLLTSNRKKLSETFLFSEGIENHLVKVAEQCSDYQSFINQTTNYRYTSSRIRRCCLQAMNQLSKQEAQEFTTPNYLRILGFNNQGRKWLKEQKEREINIVSRFAEIPEPFKQWELKTTQLYTSVLSEEERKRILTLEISGAKYINK